MYNKFIKIVYFIFAISVIYEIVATILTDHKLSDFHTLIWGLMLLLCIPNLAKRENK